jgi:hypothetical protein
VSEERSPVKDLDWLVETEARLDGLLQAARVEASEMIAQARDRIARAEERRAADYETARQDLERQIAQERDRELTRIRDEAKRLTARYATQSPEQIEALAGWVARAMRGQTAQEAAP